MGLLKVSEEKFGDDGVRTTYYDAEKQTYVTKEDTGTPPNMTDSTPGDNPGVRLRGAS